MNILIGKFGRSIYFDQTSWSMYAGDEEAPLLYRMLAVRYPEHKFYLVGKSDCTRYRAKGGFVAKNIIDLWDDFPTGTDEYPHRWLESKVKRLKLKFDVGIIYQGPSPAMSIPDVGTKRIGSTEDCKPLVMMQNYYAPPLHILNVTGTPYFLINGDPRYVPIRARDIVNDEQFVLSQITTKRTIKRVNEYFGSGLRDHTINYEYAAVETIFMTQEKRVDFRRINKHTQFVMTLNGSRDREEIVEEWLIKPSYSKCEKIYGTSWSDKIVDKYPEFFEAKAISQMEDLMWDARYTFIPPFLKTIPEFVTQKFWKMIHYGIIPFFHPKYDTGRYFNVPDFLRVSSPGQLWARIDELDKDTVKYQNILYSLWDMLKPEYYDGRYLSKLMSDSVKRCIRRPL